MRPTAVRPAGVRSAAVRSAAVRSAAVAALALGLVGGCTSSGNATPGPTRTASTAGSSTPPGPTLVQNPLPTRLNNQPAVRKDVAQTSCAAVPGGWRVEGTVTNSAARARTYTIVAFFTTLQATTLDYARTAVAVGPGQTKPWTASKRFAAQKQMRCVLAAISAS